uniref:Ig-like domain-containing protein n=1 Tax=Chelonoidis abingdonii TaxID=106734 RepID=A0A8C0H5V2_CHEAB
MKGRLYVSQTHRLGPLVAPCGPWGVPLSVRQPFSGVQSLLGSGPSTSWSRTSLSLSTSVSAVGPLGSPLNLPQDVLACSWYQAATADEDSWILTYYPQTPPVGLHISGKCHPRALPCPSDGTSGISSLSGACLGHGGNLPSNTDTAGQPETPCPLSWESGPVLEDGTFTLLCISSPSADTELWLRDGASLVPSERLGLSSDNRTLTVLGVTRSDAGTYQCEVGNPVSTNRSEPSTVTLVCLSARVVTGIIIGRTGAKGLSALGAWPFCCPTYWSPGSAVLPATSQLLPRLRWSCCSPACGWSTTAARATDPLQAPLRQLHQSHGPADPPQAPLRQLHQSRGPANPPQAPLRQLHRSCGPANPPQAPLRQLHRSCGPADPPQAPLRQLHRSRGPADPPQAPLRQLHRSRLLPFRQNAAA